MIKDKSCKFIVVLLFCICIVELFYKLGDIPNGINVDEAGSFYDAISLSKYGVDRYLYHNPVYFINFGGGQNALYTYLAIIFMNIFGVSLWSFRLVAVVLSLLSYLFYYKMLSKYDNKLKGIFVLFLLTILPFYIMKSRWGLESYLLNSLLIISLYFFVSAIYKNSNIYYFISGILFGVILYTYAISYLILPLFLAIMIIYLFLNKKINISNILYLVIPIIILAIPLILMLFVNNGIIKKEIVTNYISIPKLWNYRGGEISIKNIKYIFYDLIIIFCGDLFAHNTIFKYYTMFYISPILIIGGIVVILRKFEKKYNLIDIIMFDLFIVTLLVSFLIQDLNVNKINAIYIPFVYFIATFIKYLYDRRYNIMLFIIIIFYSINYIQFVNYYFEDYTINSSLFVDNDYFYALKFAEKIFDNGIYSNICIDTDKGQDYIYTLLYDSISPYAFNKGLILGKIDYGYTVLNYGKYVFEFNKINNDYIYFINKDNDIVNNLIDNGFDCVKFKNYYVLYKE